MGIELQNLGMLHAHERIREQKHSYKHKEIIHSKTLATSHPDNRVEK